MKHSIEKSWQLTRTFLASYQKGGSKITEIRRLSGSRISIAKVTHDDTGERMFTIQGTAESNEKALFFLYTSLESEKERRASAAAAAAATAASAFTAVSGIANENAMDGVEIS